MKTTGADPKFSGGGSDKCPPKAYHPTGVRERTPPDNYRLSHALETITFLAIFNMDCS